MIAWGKGSLAKMLGMPDGECPPRLALYRRRLRRQAVRARRRGAGGARPRKAAGRPVKVALTRPLIANNTTHRPATIQRIRIGATPDGKITAIAHESTSGNLPDGEPETAVDADQAALRRRQPHDRHAARRARPARGQRHARARRGAGPDGARDRHGRDGGEARHRPGRVPHPATTRRSIRSSRSGPSRTATSSAA